MSSENTHTLLERFYAKLEAREWDAWCVLLHPDVVYEVQQSRERVSGREAYRRFNEEFPGDWHLDVKRIVAEDDEGVVWLRARTDGDDEVDAIAFVTVKDGLVASVVDFWPEAYEPPPGREHLVERW